MRKWIVKLSPIALFLAFIPIAHCIKQNSPNRDDIKFKQLEQIATITPKFADFGSGTIYTGSAADDAGIFNHYRSTANYNEVRKFYVTQLSQTGWTLSRETSKGLEFRKDEFLIAIEYTSSTNDWNYAVSFVWRDHY